VIFFYPTFRTALEHMWTDFVACPRQSGTQSVIKLIFKRKCPTHITINSMNKEFLYPKMLAKMLTHLNQSNKALPMAKNIFTVFYS
jgi:hypothetical protein